MTIIMLFAPLFDLYGNLEERRKPPLKWVSFGLYLLGTISVSFTGFMGGTMVYKSF